MMAAESLDAWFKREILVHEEALVRYLTRMWRNREEVFGRVLTGRLRMATAPSSRAGSSSSRSILVSWSSASSRALDAT